MKRVLLFVPLILILLLLALPLGVGAEDVPPVTATPVAGDTPVEPEPGFSFLGLSAVEIVAVLLSIGLIYIAKTNGSGLVPKETVDRQLEFLEISVDKITAAIPGNFDDTLARYGKALVRELIADGTLLPGPNVPPAPPAEVG
jgi:hypothetical protein